jgi:uncharacterized repeat protein (TIGR01451 family)
MSNRHGLTVKIALYCQSAHLTKLFSEVIDSKIFEQYNQPYEYFWVMFHGCDDPASRSGRFSFLQVTKVRTLASKQRTPPKTGRVFFIFAHHPDHSFTKNQFSSEPSMYLSLKRVFRFVLFAAVLLGMLLRAPASAYAAASLTITPVTWNVVGLDSNNVNVGPSNFPVGARVCNTGDVIANNVIVDFVWDDGLNDFNGDPYINLRSGSYSTLTVPGLAAGACKDFYFEITVTRSAASYDKTRDYHISADSDETALISTPSPREIYVEHLVSQNRNSVTDVKLNGVSIAAGGTMSLMVGSTYTIQLVAATATNGYEQIESFINFPNTIFQVNSVTASYSAFPTPHTDLIWASKLYADGCGWVNDPNDIVAPAYRECTGAGKYGGNITITYNITIIGGGGTDQTLNTLIYDFSGSSYHYNSDFSSSYRVAVITDPSLCTQVTIAEWNFDLSLNAVSTDNAVGTPGINTGAGLSTATSVTGNPGSARAHTSWNTGTFDVNTTDYLQFNVSTEGYYNIQYAYDVYRSAQGPILVAPAYDGDNTGAPSARAARNLSNNSEWYSFSDDLSSITGMAGAPQARFLLYGYLAGGTGGSLRVDNFKVTGCAFPASLNLVKTASTDSFTTAGQEVTYNYTLDNPSQVPLRAPFTLTDDKIPGVSCASPATMGDMDVYLDPGESLTCTATYTIAAADLLNGSVTNIASTTGDNAATGTTVTSNTATKTITAAALTILKEVSSDGITWSDTEVMANVGDTVTYRITLDNTGNTDLTNITVSDSMPACTLAGNIGDVDADNTLDVTEVWVYTCSVTAIAGINTNTAAADSDQTAPATDDAAYVGVQPDLTVTKTNDVSGSLPENASFQWTITVLNKGVGDAIFTEGQKILSDPLPAGATYNPVLLMGGRLFSELECSISSGTLICSVAPGGGVTIDPGDGFSVTVNVSSTAPATLSNTATVDPDNETLEGNEINNSATDDVTVIDVPDAIDDSASTNEGVAVATGVLTNDGLGTEPTAITANTQGTSGTVTCTAGVCTYTPAAGFTGTDSYTYTITDANGNRDTAIVLVTVIDLPDAVDDTGTTNEGVSVTTGVLTNDDLGAEPTTITSHTDGANGAVNCTETQCTYIPNPGFTGTDTYTYTITDASENTATATVTITIVNLPDAVDDSATTSEGRRSLRVP